MKKIMKKENAMQVTIKGGAKGLVAAGALAAAIGGIYLLGFSDKKKNAKAKKTAKAWILRAKADVMEDLQKLPHVTRKAYLGIVTAVIKHYEKVKDVSKDELVGLKKELEDQWESVVNDLKKE